MHVEMTSGVSSARSRSGPGPDRPRGDPGTLREGVTAGGPPVPSPDAGAGFGAAEPPPAGAEVDAGPGGAAPGGPRRAGRGRRTGGLARWMGKRPASVAAHLHYYLHERFRRSDGREGWDLDTAIPLVNGLYAAVYRAFGLTWGLVFGCLWPYASAWVNQRPLRALTAVAVRALIVVNVVTWLTHLRGG